eukprot:m51a1_g11119 hypothetical protein (835) ;mRNA; r:109237-112693
MAKPGLYIWGRGGDGQLGHGDTGDRLLPSLVRSLNCRVVSIACGGKHTAVVTETGDVYTWGWNWSGQLGLGDMADRPSPAVVKGLALAKTLERKRFVQVAAGNDHTVALADTGAVYAWGGCQGPDPADHQLVPRLVLGLHSQKATKVSCGSGHTLCLTSTGLVFSWGKASNGRLGLGSGVGEFVAAPTRLRDLPPAIDVECGWSHSLCLTERHEPRTRTRTQVYSWGKGRDGQLGHGDQLDAYEPRRVEYFVAREVAVVRLSGGYFHSAAVSAGSKLYTWGFGDYGQLGHEGNVSEALPRPVDALSGLVVALVACGGVHTLVADSMGTLYSFGSGEYGQLGTEEAASALRGGPASATPPPSASPQLGGHRGRTNAPPAPPTVVRTLGDVHVSLIAAGYWHSIAFAGASNTLRGSLVASADQSGSAYVCQRIGGAGVVALSPPRPTYAGMERDRAFVSGPDGPAAAAPCAPAAGPAEPEPPAPLQSSPEPSDSEREGAERLALSSSSASSSQPQPQAQQQQQQQQATFSLRDERRTEEAEGFWRSVVVPRWGRYAGTRKLRALLWGGVPPRVRGEVWKAAIGNRLGMTRELYEIYARHGREELERSAGVGTARMIEVDLPRTFPSLFFFNNTGPFYRQLMELLATWAQHRPDIGYVQGMSHIAAMLVLQMEPYESYRCFINLVSSRLLLAFFKMDLPMVLRHLKVFDIIFQYNMPALCRHFAELEVSPNYYLLDWFMTMFTHVLPIPVASRVWDCYLADGELLLHRAALAILKRHSARLLAADFEGCVSFLRAIPKDVSEAEQIALTESVEVPSSLQAVFDRIMTHTTPPLPEDL